ncbi:MAG: hypothetical protein IKQ22_03570 [Clostridia bacterium]|nr:hypothetical protein [Clostridia bacterium]
MTTVKFTIGTKVYDVPANDSREISDSKGTIPEAVVKYLKAAERVDHSSKGKPIVKDDTGKRFVIGCKTCCKDDEKLCSGVSGGSSKIPASFWQDVAKLKDKLSKESQDIINENLLSSMSKEELLALIMNRK